VHRATFLTCLQFYGSGTLRRSHISNVQLIIPSVARPLPGHSLFVTLLNRLLELSSYHHSHEHLPHTRYDPRFGCDALHCSLPNEKLTSGVKCSGSLPSRLNPHTPPKDEVLPRAPFQPEASRILTKLLAQSCSGISFKSQALYMIVYSTRYLGKQFLQARHHTELNFYNRHLLDPHLRLPLQYRLQNPLPRLASLHNLPHAKRLQANARPKHRHPTSAIPPRRQCAPSRPIPLPLRNHRGTPSPTQPTSTHH